MDRSKPATGISGTPQKFLLRKGFPQSWLEVHWYSIANKHQCTNKRGLPQPLGLADPIGQQIKNCVFLSEPSVKSFLIAAIKDKWFAETGQAWYTGGEQPMPHASVQVTDRFERIG